MDELVTSLMTTPVTTVDADDTVEAVSEVLRLNGLSFAPVLERPDGPPLGIISADALLQFKAARRDPATVRAWEICSYRPVQVGADATLAEVARLMLEHQIHHIVVMENDSLKGVVSSLDFVKRYLPGA